MFYSSLPLSRRQFVLGFTSLISAPFFGDMSQVKAQVLGQPILTVSGPQATLVSRWAEEDFSKLEWRELATSTPWTQGVQHFKGPLLRDVLIAHFKDEADLASRTLRFKAMNGFSVEFLAIDAWDFDCIVARELNGKPMRIRDKGPLWLIYPRDNDPRLKDVLREERWVWQLDRIQIL